MFRESDRERPRVRVTATVFSAMSARCSASSIIDCALRYLFIVIVTTSSCKHEECVVIYCIDGYTTYDIRHTTVMHGTFATVLLVLFTWYCSKTNHNSSKTITDNCLNTIIFIVIFIVCRQMNQEYHK